jgi:hypothetical protein
MKPEVKAIYAALWGVVEDLRSGDLETERGAVVVSALDSLIELQRLEIQEAQTQDLGALEKPQEEHKGHAEERSKGGRG